VETGIERLSAARIYPVAHVNETLEKLGTGPLRNPASLFQLLKRDEITYDTMDAFDGWAPISDRYVKRQIEIEAKYEGYIKRQRESVDRLKAAEQRKIAGDMDYDEVPGLSNELRMKFKKVLPETVGQAGRIPGMTQAAISAVLIAMKRRDADREQKKDNTQEVK